MMVHNEGTREDKMDSLTKKYWALHLLNERLSLMLADRVFAVNSSIAARVATLSRAFAAKTEVLSVSVDTERFVSSPFDQDGDTFRVCFAGRLDAFKDPPLMFATLARLAEKMKGRAQGRFRRVAFDYIGASDPAREPAFAGIADLTVRHGIRSASEVAAIVRRAHAGLITSFFEGMPCYLLEMLASGRPVVAVDLPQFEPLIHPGVSGILVARRKSPDNSAEVLSDALLALAGGVETGELEPGAIAALAAPFSVEAQMHRLFLCHEALALRARPGYGREPIRSA
jgi:glycosyltransferase involved in cell wall biosynthesis